jgi:hypothetical protein
MMPRNQLFGHPVAPAIQINNLRNVRRPSITGYWTVVCREFALVSGPAAGIDCRPTLAPERNSRFRKGQATVATIPSAEPISIREAQAYVALLEIAVWSGGSAYRRLTRGQIGIRHLSIANG